MWNVSKHGIMWPVSHHVQKWLIFISVSVLTGSSPHITTESNAACVVRAEVQSFGSESKPEIRCKCTVNNNSQQFYGRK